MLHLRTAMLLLIPILPGCVVGPDHKPPTVALPRAYAEGGQKNNGDTSGIAWWGAFRDARLSGYLRAGLEQNLDVQQALERVIAAQADVTIAGAGSLPALTASASDTVSGVRGNSDSRTTQNLGSGGLDASWFLDLFGSYRRAKERALADLGAAYASVNVARLTLLSQVAAAYIDVRYYQQRLSVARQSLASRRETVKLTKLQLEAGAAARLDVVQSEGLVYSSLAEIPGLETNILRATHRVATLLARPAADLDADLGRDPRQPVASANIDAGVPADLLRNRPDIKAAERRLASAVANIGVAEAQLYPALTLGGAVTANALAVKGGGNSNPLSWSFGPALTLPILDGGALRANVAASQSQAREAYLAWKSTVLNAVEEVENALAAYRRDSQTLAASQRAVRSYQEALQLATSSYRDGASSLLDVLDAQRQVSAAQVGVADALRQMAQDYVALNIAIGSGYAAFDQPVVKTDAK